LGRPYPKGVGQQWLAIRSGCELAKRIAARKWLQPIVLALSEANRGESAQDRRTIPAKIQLTGLAIDKKRKIRISADLRRRIALNAELFSALYSN
jgi:hypothetical protein